MRSRSSSPVLGTLRRLAIATLPFALLIAVTSLAFPALAAEVVDVRVGLHPTFTRVVFELDSAAGYQLSKGSGSGSGEELVVILQASSIPRSVQAPRKSLLGLVRVSPDGRNSIARIELKQKGLVVKERIMSSPYRVVLDVIDPEAEAATETPPAPKPAPRPAPKPAATPPKPAPTPPAPAPEPTPAPTPPKPAAKASPPEPTPQLDDDLLGETNTAPKPAEPERRIGQAPPVPTPRTAASEPSEGGIATMGQADKVSPPKKPASPPKARMADTGDDGFGSVFMIGGGVLLAVFALLFAMRMRARKNAETDAELERESETGPSNPFASLRDDEDDEPARPAPAPAPAQDGPQLTLDSLVDDMPATAPGPGDDGLAATTISARTAEEDDDDDSPFALTQEEEDDDGTAVPATPLGDADDGDEEIGEEEMSRLIQQFEQRIAALESRLDEQAEARERLERQVAAQTEELRVQRAAIARTQRAVRNLTRGEEDGPTEPALRDPNG